MPAPSSGFVVGIDIDVLHRAALDADAIVVVDKLVGDALVVGTPIGRTWAVSGGQLSESGVGAVERGLRAGLQTEFERTSHQDVAFGLRQLTDVAVKALSPGINDPTTAVHALNHTAALLCDLVHRDLDAEVVRDDAGRVRVVVRQRSFTELLDLATAQPRVYGSDDPFVMRALLELLQAVAWVASAPEQVSAVEGQLARARSVIEQGSLDDVHRQELVALAGAVGATLDGRGAA